MGQCSWSASSQGAGLWYLFVAICFLAGAQRAAAGHGARVTDPWCPWTFLMSAVSERTGSQTVAKEIRDVIMDISRERVS